MHRSVISAYAREKRKSDQGPCTVWLSAVIQCAHTLALARYRRDIQERLQGREGIIQGHATARACPAGWRLVRTLSFQSVLSTPTPKTDTKPKPSLISQAPCFMGRRSGLRRAQSVSTAANR